MTCFNWRSCSHILKNLFLASKHAMTSIYLKTPVFGARLQVIFSGESFAEQFNLIFCQRFSWQVSKHFTGWTTLNIQISQFYFCFYKAQFDCKMLLFLRVHCLFGSRDSRLIVHMYLRRLFRICSYLLC